MCQARASFLPTAFIMQRLLQLCAWAAAFLDRHEEALASGNDSAQSQDVFDAVCQVTAARKVFGKLPAHSSHAQAVLYVLCYRMEAIADSGAASLAQMRSLPLDRCGTWL